MSSISSPVTPEHFAYLAERTVQEDRFLAELKEAALEAGIPPIWISPEQASFMQILLKLVDAEQVLEVGTLAGYSAIVMARAVRPKGKVTTVELIPKHANFAKEWVARSDVSDKVEVLEGAGKDVLPKLKDDSFDACFLDADKSGYKGYLKECLRLVRKGGLFMVDNAFAFGQLLDENPTDQEVPDVRAFNDHMATVKELHSIIVPLGDGVWVGVKK